MTCFVSKPSRITLVELSIINTSYQKLPPCVSRVVYIIFHPNRERRFLELSRSFLTPKTSPKNGIFSFLGYLGEIESGAQTEWTSIYAKLCHGQRFQSSSPHLQWLTRFDLMNPYRLFGWPGSYLKICLLYTSPSPRD